MDYFNRSTGSPFGKLDVRLKMATGFAVSLIVILVDTGTALSICALAGICCFALCRPNRSQVVLVTGTTLLIVWGLMFSQGLFYAQEPRHVLLTLLPPNPVFKAGLRIYVQGLYHGAIQSLRIIATTLTGFAICFSTDPDRFLRGLLAVRIPFSISFMAVSAIRFIPIAAQEVATVRHAMRLKGYRPFKRGVMDTVHSEIVSLRPVLAGTIRRSQEIALSIQSRGFTLNGNRSSLTEHKLSVPEKCSLAGIVTLTVAMLVCKVLFMLYQYDFYYAPQLRPLYGFVRTWL